MYLLLAYLDNPKKNFKKYAIFSYLVFIFQLFFLYFSCDLTLVEEEQGEAIGVDAAGLGFYTTSEGKNQPIYYYEFN